MKDYQDIMQIAFQAEEGINERIISRFGKQYVDKQLIIKESEITQQIFWIMDGEVYITRKSGSKYKVIAVLGKGEIFGEMSFFDKSVRSASVIAKGEVTALVFTPENFADIFQASPQWTKKMLLMLSILIKNMLDLLIRPH